MTEINDLSQVDALAVGDQFPIWQAAAGSTRRVSASSLTGFIRETYGVQAQEVYATRALMVSDIAEGRLSPIAGMTYFAGGLSYMGRTGASGISDSPGLEPNGFATPGHWGATAGQTGVDESNKVQAAMVWAAANTGRLVFDGVYRSDGVNGQSGLICDGLNRTGGIVSLSVLSFTGTLSGQHVINCEGLSDFSFVGMVFDNSNNTRFVSGLRTISMYNCHRFIVENCKFSGGGASTAAVNCSNYRVIGNDTTTQTLYTVSTVPTMQHDGVYDQWWGSHDFEISGNTVTKGNVAGLYPILVTGTDAGSTNPTKCYNFTIIGNKILGFTQSGIWAQGRHGGCEDFKITGNLLDGLTDSLYHGLVVTAGLRGVINANIVRNTNNTGIRLYKEGGSNEVGIHSNEDIVVSDNIVENVNLAGVTTNEGSAIIIRDNFKRISVIGNSVAGTTHSHAVYVDGGGTNETNCVVFGGVYADGTQGTVTFGSTPDQSAAVYVDSAGVFQANGDINVAGQSLVKSGSAATPSVAFQVDQTTGVFRAGASSVGISLGGVARATFDAAGLNVRGSTTDAIAAKIGFARSGDGNSTVALVSDATNTNGGTLLTRYGGINGTAEIRHKGTGSFQNVLEGAASWIVSQNGTETMRATSSNTVGIGTNGPTAKLDVSGQIRSRASTVASLIVPATIGSGAMAFVTDSTLTHSSANIGSVVTGGGANFSPVYCDGTNWRIG